VVAVIGYLVVAGLAIGAALLVAGPHHVIKRDPSFELDKVSDRLVEILSALTGFAVTGLIFLVTQSNQVPEPNGTSFTAVLAMFVVAYMGYYSSGVLIANVSHGAQDPTFDLAAAQYAGASISLFSVILGWFALKPLFETFGLTAIASLTGWLLLGAAIGGYGLLANALHRTGYATARLAVLLALFALVGTCAYAIVVGVVAPSLRSPEATLSLTIVAFVAGLVAYLAMTILPSAVRRERLGAILSDRWHLAIVAYAQAVTLLIGFLLLAVHGLA
jgi:hypothetical protein